MFYTDIVLSSAISLSMTKAQKAFETKVCLLIVVVIVSAGMVLGHCTQKY